jgi:hypothetical protein
MLSIMARLRQTDGLWVAFTETTGCFAVSPLPFFGTVDLIH